MSGLIGATTGGLNTSVQMLRDLRGVLERERAAIALFVTLAKPTGPMNTEAVKAGFYASAQGRKYPSVQILTIEGLLDGTERPNFPDLSLGGRTFKRARLVWVGVSGRYKG